MRSSFELRITIDSPHLMKRWRAFKKLIITIPHQFLNLLLSNIHLNR